ncbi:hypothetical protein SAMN05216567_103215 [Variovorax sp. OK605]|jgi:hypothetical protein|uniref:hypothetical protein n=1 Tax=Variovorax sp. OK605 TaxID=1855317 RepID=UPI0008EFDEFD|nr:hypothetical protein [Variovorax sp. OK605]SFO89300.1 hypothetical protein SAMN05216567_103215 [Variovorax sp. OK605]
MVTLDAAVECVEEKYFLKINIEQGPVTIPLSDDNPNAVKSAFNKLIQRIGIGEFIVKLDKVGEDLFSMVANEYLVQLNREIQEVRSQMQEYGLIKVEQA